MDWFAVNCAKKCKMYPKSRQNARYDLQVGSYWMVLSFFGLCILHNFAGYLLQMRQQSVKIPRFAADRLKNSGNLM